MAADRDVEFDLLATDKTSKATRTATKNFTELKKKVDASSKSNDKWKKALTDVTKRVGTMAKGVLKGASAVAALGSVVGPAVTGLIGLGKGIVAVGKGVAGLAPLVAFVPSLAGAVGLIVGTLKLAAPGLATAFQPVVRAFFDADGNATALTKTIQNLASDGVAPLAKQFTKVNLPFIVAAMDQIAMATNGVIVRTLQWVNSAEGISLIRSITGATADTFNALAPKIDTAVVALLRLSGRAGDKAITGLGGVIGKILDKFTAWADSTSVDDINASLDKLKGGWGKVTETFDHVKEVVTWVVENQAKIQAFSTAMGVFALIGSVVTGQWWAAIVAGISILLGNWSKVTTTFTGVKAWWQGVWNGIKDDPVVKNLLAAVDSQFSDLQRIVTDWWTTFQTKVAPPLKDLIADVHDKLIPAATDFLTAIKPIVDAIAQILLPIVTAAFLGMVDVLDTATKKLSALLEFAAWVTNIWNGVWDGVKIIFTAVWDWIVGRAQWAWTSIKSEFAGGIAQVTGAAGGFKDKIVGLFSAAASWLKGVGGAIVQGLADGISAGWSKVSGAIGGLLTKAKNAIPSWARSALGFGADTNGWRPAQFAAQFAGGGGGNFAAGGGGSRTGGPTPVSVDVGVSLDGAPFYAMTSKVVVASEKRTAWRTKVGKRS